MSEQDPKEKLEKDLQKFKDKKKKKLTVPPEFLQEAKSYEDKVILVKMLTEKEKNRMILLIKGMLKEAVEERDNIKSKKK